MLDCGIIFYRRAIIIILFNFWTCFTAIPDPRVRPREEATATAGWFIGVMVALAFLLLVLVLVCVARRNRGGKYDVHDRERAHGRADCPDAAFHEYTHPSVYYYQRETWKMETFYLNIFFPD